MSYVVIPAGVFLQKMSFFNNDKCLGRFAENLNNARTKRKFNFVKNLEQDIWKPNKVTVKLVNPSPTPLHLKAILDSFPSPNRDFGFRDLRFETGGVGKVFSEGRKILKINLKIEILVADFSETNNQKNLDSFWDWESRICLRRSLLGSGGMDKAEGAVESKQCNTLTQRI